MILAPTLTLNSVRGPSVDPDAAAFAATSGATDVAALSAFVTGVKALGLWNSMVCWPLRSTQNAGTGATAYSLGGLGTYNGTLVNGPVWASNWMEFSATNARMTCDVLPTNFNEFTLFAAANTINESAVFSVIGSGSGPAQSASNSTYVSTTVSNNNAHLVYGNGTSAVAITPRISSGPRIFCVTTTGPSGTIAAYQDGAQLSSSSQGSASPTLQNFTVAARPHDRFGSNNVQAALAAAFQGALSEAQYLSVRALYKQTLGTGLGLP
jgi:hypothetical protein